MKPSEVFQHWVSATGEEAEKVLPASDAAKVHVFSAL